MVGQGLGYGPDLRPTFVALVAAAAGLAFVAQETLVRK